MIKGIIFIVVGIWFSLYIIPIDIAVVRDGLDVGGVITIGLSFVFPGSLYFLGGFFIRRHIIHKRKSKKVIEDV